MTLVTVVDLETTGFSKTNDDIIEFGAAQYNWESKKPILLQSDLVLTDKKLSPEILRVTGIEQYMVEKPFAIPLKTAMFRLKKIIEQSDYVVAHNAKFDLGFLSEAEKKTGIILDKKPIIDTRTDLPIDASIKTRKLNYLLAEHNLFNPFAHRALFDCMSTFQLMTCYKLEDILLNQKSPLLTVKAIVDFHEKDSAKEAGFHWDGKTKSWLLDIKKYQYEAIKYDFETKIIAGDDEEFDIPF